MNIVNKLNESNGPCDTFELRVGTSTGVNNGSMRIICQRGRKCNKTKSTKNKTSTSFAASTAEKCSFYFTIHKDTELNRWYIRKSSGFCWCHKGHPPMLRKHRETTIRSVPDDVLKTAEVLLENLVPPKMVDIFINSTTGLTLSDASMQHMRKLVLDSKYKLDADETTAQKLVKILDRTPGVTYVTYTGESFMYCLFRIFRHFRIYHFFRIFRILGSYDQATQKVRVRKKNKNGLAGKSESEVQNLTKKTEKFIQSVIQGLDLGNQEFLLGVT